MPAGEIFQIERNVRSGLNGMDGSTLTPSGLRTEGVGVGDADAVAEVVGDGLAVGPADVCDVWAEPTTQMFPAESKVAAVAISFEPLSSGKDHCTVPVESRA